MDGRRPQPRTTNQLTNQLQLPPSRAERLAGVRCWFV